MKFLLRTFLSIPFTKNSEMNSYHSMHEIMQMYIHMCTWLIEGKVAHTNIVGAVSIIRYRWIKNGKEFDWQTYDNRISQQPGRGTLVITSPRDEDLGKLSLFICKILITTLKYIFLYIFTIYSNLLNFEMYHQIRKIFSFSLEDI